MTAWIREKQLAFTKKLLSRDVPDDYTKVIMEMAKDARTAEGAMLRKLPLVNNYREADVKARMDRVRTSTKTRNVTYAHINPTLQPRSVLQAGCLPEWQRTALTRMRVGSHNLQVEKGRWARIPREERLRSCLQEVQDEKHVLLRCPKTQKLRTEFFANSSPDFVRVLNPSKEDYSASGSYIYKCFGVYE